MIIRETAEMSDTERMAARNSNSEYLNEETNKREPLSNKVNSFSEDVSEDDAKAQYPSIQCLKNMVHIVESGTDGIWNYRKWSDGTAECWGRIDYNMGTFNTQSGSLYIADNLCESVNYPSYLFIEAPVEVASAIAGNYAIWLAPWDGAGTKDHTAQYKAIRTSSTNSTSLSGYISLIAKGKWK